METEVIYQNQFQKEYFLADSRGKIDIILSNYVTFQHQLSGIEKGIKLDIKVDQNFCFRKERGNLGVRVCLQNVADDKDINVKTIYQKVWRVKSRYFEWRITPCMACFFKIA